MNAYRTNLVAGPHATIFDKEQVRRDEPLLGLAKLPQRVQVGLQVVLIRDGVGIEAISYHDLDLWELVQEGSIELEM